MRTVLLCALLAVAFARSSVAQLPRLAINDNRSPAGTLKHGVLDIELEITTGMWHPDGDNAPGIAAIAFAEAGQRPSMPAPLIRVPQGTVVRARVRNTLNESMIVFGLRSHALLDTVRIAAGGVHEFSITAAAPGNYGYGALRAFRVPSPENPATGNDLAAAGAFVVDDAVSAQQRDRVFVINMMARANRPPQRSELTTIIATLNGRAWPHNERPMHQVGDTIVWRIINASLIPHPMHLHGFFFDLLTRGYSSGQPDSIFSREQVRRAVTERLLPYQSMTMRWVPDRAGNWLFHCHLPVHTALRAPFGPMKASATMHKHDAMNGMQNLMMGVTVQGPAAVEPASRRAYRLLVQGGDSVAGELGPRYRYTLNGLPNPKAAGPTIVLEQNQPAAITVVNDMREATAVHWHGIELESFNDGVAGFGGHGNRIAPLIEPGDSFVARMTPPRAGTFIYHTHVDERRQMGGGLYGALIVVPSGQTYDRQHDRVIVLGSASDTTPILFNGEKDYQMTLSAGETYRLRFVHIMIARPAMYVALVDDAGKEQEWKLVAKDGADLPAHQLRVTRARQSMSNGETYDVEFTPRQAGSYRLEARAGNGTVFGQVRVIAQPDHL